MWRSMISRASGSLGGASDLVVGACAWNGANSSAASVTSLKNMQELLEQAGKLSKFNSNRGFDGSPDPGRRRLRPCLGDLRHDADDVMKLDAIAGFKVPRHRFLAHAREAHLPLRVVRVGVIHVERDLAVDTDRLHLLDDRRLRPLEHSVSIDPRPRAQGPGPRAGSAAPGFHEHIDIVGPRVPEREADPAVALLGDDGWNRAGGQVPPGRQHHVVAGTAEAAVPHQLAVDVAVARRIAET